MRKQEKETGSGKVERQPLARKPLAGCGVRGARRRRDAVAVLCAFVSSRVRRPPLGAQLGLHLRGWEMNPGLMHTCIMGPKCRVKSETCDSPSVKLKVASAHRRRK